MAGVYGNINSLDDFYRELDAALATARHYESLNAQNRVAQSIARQLEALKQWTAGGHPPTDEQRNRLTINVLVVREMNSGDTGDPRADEWALRLNYLMNFVEGWPDDWRAANPPDDELDRLFELQRRRKYSLKPKSD